MSIASEEAAFPATSAKGKERKRGERRGERERERERERGGGERASAWSPGTGTAGGVNGWQ